jgi:hypothetical protein
VEFARGQFRAPANARTPAGSPAAGAQHPGAHAGLGPGLALEESLGAAAGTPAQPLPLPKAEGLSGEALDISPPLDQQ